MNLHLVQFEQELNRWQLNQRETLQRMEWQAGTRPWPAARRLAGWLGARLVTSGERLSRWSATHTATDYAREFTPS